LTGILDGVLVEHFFVEGEVQLVSSGHQMVAVVNLDERLDLAPLGLLLLSHSLCDLLRVSLDSYHEGMSVRPVTGSLVLVLDDHGFSASISAIQDQDNLAGLYNTAHTY